MTHLHVFQCQLTVLCSKTKHVLNVSKDISLQTHQTQQLELHVSKLLQIAHKLMNQEIVPNVNKDLILTRMDNAIFLVQTVQTLTEMESA